MKTEHKKIEDRLWELIQRYIGLRDAGKSCISCGRWYQIMDCGHYYGRGAYPALRYDEDNIHKQCRRCNIQSNTQGYKDGLLQRYGQEFLDKLELKARIIRQYRKEDLKLLIIYFQEKLNNG